MTGRTLADPIHKHIAANSFLKVIKSQPKKKLNNLTQ